MATLSAIAALGFSAQPAAAADPPWWCQYIPPEFWPPECEGDGGGDATPPEQPAGGPGGSAYAHDGMTVRQGGSGSSAWYVFQPTGPRPESAPVSIMLHGFGETEGHNVMHNMIEHTVRKGYVVIYPRYQSSLFEFDWSITTANAVRGVRGGLAWLRTDPGRVQPGLGKVGYMGHSYGGILAANMANRHGELGLPEPASLYLFEPHGGIAGNGFDRDMSGIPASTKVNCHISEEWDSTNEGCHFFFPRIGHISNAGKDFVVTYSDRHGTPPLVANHNSICATQGATACYPEDPTDPSRDYESERRTDAMDFYGHWAPWIGLQACANAGNHCEYALGDTAEHRDMGEWSDGTPVREKRIADAPVAP